MIELYRLLNTGHIKFNWRQSTLIEEELGFHGKIYRNSLELYILLYHLLGNLMPDIVFTVQICVSRNK